MSTSGETTGLATVRDIIKLAFEVCGVDDNHEDAESYDLGMRHLNWMLKSWQMDGCNLWRELTETITWTANNQSQTLSPNVVDIQSARYVQSATYERDLARYERGDYNILPNKAAQGMPTIYSFLKQTGNAKLYIWPVPTTNITIKAEVARVIEDVTDLTQEIDLPQEYTEAVVYNLADRMCEPFSVSISQPPVAAEIKRRAADLYAKLLNADRPSSVFISPWGMAH